MKELKEKFTGLLDIIKVGDIAEVRYVHPDKEIHPQILFNFYNELYSLGYNIKVYVI